MKNIHNNVFHLNKLPGHKRSSPLLLSSLLRHRTGKIYTVSCNAYALSFIFPGCSLTTYLHVELHQFLLLARSSRRSFCEQRNPIHWVKLTWSSPRAPRICGNLWNIAHSRTNERATKLRIADLRQVFGFNDRNATLQVDFFTHRLHSNSNSSTVLCFTEQNSNSVSFLQSQCYRFRKILLS